MGKSDYVQIQYSIENAKQVESLVPPAFPDFTIVQGPIESNSSVSTNGVVVESVSISFILQPKHAGKFTIKGATAKVDGQSLHSGPIAINVRNVVSFGNTSQSNNFSPLPDPGWPSAEQQVDVETLIKPGENVAEKIKKNFFIRVDVSKNDCYLGEPIVVTYKLYTRLHTESRVTKQPSLNGFSVYDMMDPTDDQSTVEKVNGKNFTVHLIRRAQLIALQPGDIELDPVQIENTIYFTKLEKGQSGSQGYGSLLDRLFNQDDPRGTPVTQQLELDSKPVVVHVKPLPEAGKPADFTGAVGNYSINAILEAKEIDTGDAALLAVTVNGTGNLPVINAPVVDWPEHMESYDVSSKENINKKIAPLGGSKTFTYSFSCNKPGNYILPPVQLFYFDPTSKSYKTVQTDPVHIKINHSGKRRLPKPAADKPYSLIAGGWAKNILWILGGLFAGTLGIYFLMRKKRVIKIAATPARKQAAVLPAGTVLAPVPVTDPLREARDLAGSGDYGKFYASVNRAVWKAVSDKLHLPASELNKLNIASGLRSGGWDDERIIQLKQLLNECEMKLYTPYYSSSDVEKTLESAAQLTAQLAAGA